MQRRHIQREALDDLKRSWLDSSYLISLTDDTNAQITMQAVVTDDAEDLQNARFFVVGVPNFAYANTSAHDSSSSRWTTKDAERDYDRKTWSVLKRNKQQALMADAREDAPISLVNGVEGDGQLSGRRFVPIQAPTVTLPKGERRQLQRLLRQRRLRAPIQLGSRRTSPRVDAFGNVINPNQNPQDGTRADSIWHSIRLKNSPTPRHSLSPATNPSAGHPHLHQKGAPSTLRIAAVATDIRASHEEREVARHPEINRRGYNYDLVTVEGN